MATRNKRSTDPANSVAESSSFTEAILSHPILLTTLEAQEILHLQHVCTAWRKWYSGEGITKTIATARQQDDSKDWYFPVLVNKSNSSQPERNSSWTWSGIWHESAHHACANMQSLPPLRHLPFEWTFSSDRRNNDIVAGDGGLLLFKTLRAGGPVRRSARLNPQPSNNYDLLRLPDGPCKSLEPLLVCNPFTKEFRVLPQAYCCIDNSPKRVIRRSASYGLQVNMVVDESANSYRVILTFRTFICMYSSTSNRWESFRFEEPGPWGRGPFYDLPWTHHVCGNVYSRGSLFFADIELARTPNPRRMTFRLRLFQINLEVAPGAWNLQQLNIPPRSLLGNFEHCVLRDIMYGIVGYRYVPRIFPDLELVECMGELYAVVPARLERSLEMGAEELRRIRPDYYEAVRHLFNAELEFMPLQFFIFQLQGGNLVHGALRIELPRSTSDIRSRWESLHQIQLRGHDPFRHCWLSCTASRSVIWVSCEDYLLQYDVVTGQSKTEIIPVNGNDHRLKFSYRPSFHMKP